ncbi:50S ribosomal protein L11 methyltransferase [Candidatus Margulisiibacteriota bacterium]
MKSYKELTIKDLNEIYEDPLIEVLTQVGAKGAFSERLEKYPHKNTKTVNIKAYFDQDLGYSRIRSFLKQRLNILGLKIIQKRIKISKYCAKKTKNAHKMIKIDDILIVSSKYKMDDKNDEKVLIIDDFMAFGTGYHETTQSCLRLLVASVKPDLKTADVGTGTGILAIACAKLGAKAVFAFENSSEAYEIAKANLRKNKVTQRVKLVKKDITKQSIGKNYGLIIANLTPEIFESILGRLKKALIKNGKLILSGIHEKYFNKFRRSLLKHKLTIQKVKKSGEWATFLVKK